MEGKLSYYFIFLTFFGVLILYRTVYQAFGTRNTGITSNGWSSHSACWVTNAAAGTTFQINLESTAGTDCIEETGWRYATFSCAYVSART